MILGSSEYPRNPRIRQGGGGGELCPSRDDPRIVRVSQESRDTQTGGGELCPSRDDPRIVPSIPGIPGYSDRGGGVELCPSRDDPRIVQVSQESQDTQTGGGGGGGVSCVHPEMMPGSSEYPRNPGIHRQGG